MLHVVRFQFQPIWKMNAKKQILILSFHTVKVEEDGYQICIFYQMRLFLIYINFKILDYIINSLHMKFSKVVFFSEAFTNRRP